MASVQRVSPDRVPAGARFAVEALAWRYGCLLLCVGSLCLSACRVENPAFVGNQDNPGATGSGSGLPDASSSEKGPGGGDPNDGATTGPQMPEGSGSGPGDPGSSGPGTDDESAPGQEAARAFCEGAAICFPIHELAPGGVVQDLGPSALTMTFQQPVNLERNWADPPPLDHSVRINPGSAGAVSAPLILPPNREIGFDIWFSPDDVGTRNWTLFEMDNLLSLERMSTGGLRCAVKNNIVHVGPVTNPQFEPGRLHHAVCAISGDRVMMWWSGKSIPYGLPIDSGTETNFAMQLGASPRNERNPFSGRVASLRIWHDVQQMRAKNNLPEPLTKPNGGQ